MILYIKHIDIEGPETLGTFFNAQGYESLTVEMGVNEQDLPQDLTGIDAIVSLGGPMNVYEEDKYPFLKKENEFIQTVLSKNIPFLGLCLGSQLLVKAAGAKVTKSPVEEIGWYNIDLFDDPLFMNMNRSLEVFHWHGDMFDIPSNGHLIAQSQGCPHQAVHVGKNAYGLQFHVEITDKSIAEWSQAYRPDDEKLQADLLADYSCKKKMFDQQANQLYLNFHNIIRSS